MADEVTDAPQENGHEDSTQPEGKVYTPEDVNRIVEERLARDRKSRDLSPDEVKALKQQAAAAKAEAEQSKTAEQKAAERIAAMEARVAETERAALVASIRAEHKISAEDSSLFLTGSDEKTLTQQAKRLAELAEAASQRGTSRDGDNPQPKSSDQRSFVSALVRGAN